MYNPSLYNQGYLDGSVKRKASIDAYTPIEETTINIYDKETKSDNTAMTRVWKIWYFLLGICIGLTPFCFYIADAARGFNGLGGEVIIPLIPFLYRYIIAPDDFKTKK